MSFESLPFPLSLQLIIWFLTLSFKQVDYDKDDEKLAYKGGQEVFAYVSSFPLFSFFPTSLSSLHHSPFSLNLSLVSPTVHPRKKS